MSPGRFYRFLENWEEKVATPILVSVLTAGVLFALALLFKPLLHWLVASPSVEHYPLVCFAEPKAGNQPGGMAVDFYILNLRANRFTRSDLEARLLERRPDPTRALSPDLRLEMKTLTPGIVVEVAHDEAFNEGKGRLETSIDPNKRGVTIVIHDIRPRAMMKVTIEYCGVPYEGDIRGTAKVLVPFDFQELQDRCVQG